MKKDNRFYELSLYVTGASPNSVKAISNLKHICEEYFSGNYKLEIIDIYQQPGVAAKQQIVALPMLLKTSPLPLKRLIGNMSDSVKVLKGLDFE